MSKSKLIELIKMDDKVLSFWLENVQTKEARELFRQALKEQDRDTRHVCAAKCHDLAISAFSDDTGSSIGFDCKLACKDYQYKDLVGLR